MFYISFIRLVRRYIAPFNWYGWSWFFVKTKTIFAILAASVAIVLLTASSLAVSAYPSYRPYVLEGPYLYTGSDAADIAHSTTVLNKGYGLTARVYTETQVYVGLFVANPLTHEERVVIEFIAEAPSGSRETHKIEVVVDPQSWVEVFAPWTPIEAGEHVVWAKLYYADMTFLEETDRLHVTALQKPNTPIIEEVGWSTDTAPAETTRASIWMGPTVSIKGSVGEPIAISFQIINPLDSVFQGKVVVVVQGPSKTQTFERSVEVPSKVWRVGKYYYRYNTYVLKWTPQEKGSYKIYVLLYDFTNRLLETSYATEVTVS